MSSEITAVSRKKILIGNEAIALGAYHAGVSYGSGYPGTPSTEILEYFSRYPGVIAEWAPNEKCAYEAAYGASLYGARAIVTMKHVGLNVASDPFITSVYSGINGGLVLVVADDPGMHSSQNEQDSRHYARLAKAPLFEPSESNEAYRMMIEAVRLSEEHDTPVIFRSVTRVSHSTSVVEPLEVVPEVQLRTYEKNPQKYVMVPAFARERKKILLQRLKALKEYAEKTELNYFEWGSEEIGIIASGVAYLYAKEVYPEASFLKLGFTYPLPEEKIRHFAAQVEAVVVIEEVDPILEEEIRALGINMFGKSLFAETGELTPDIVADGLASLAKTLSSKSFYLNWHPKEKSGVEVPRPPVLCPGCGHRNLFYMLNRLRAVVMGDIGCYTLSVNQPLNSLDTCTCMGAGIGEAHGFSRVSGKDSKKVVAVIGDSTFVHSGITGLINAVYNRSNVLILILDNRTTAMTGHQPHPGTGKTLQGEETFTLDFEELARTCGASYVATVDPYDMQKTGEVLKEAYEKEGVAVVIAKRPCVLYEREERPTYRVIEEKCTGCGACFRLGCPAIEKKEKLAVINETLCTGCAACVYVCRFDAIERIGNDGEL